MVSASPLLAEVSGYEGSPEHVAVPASVSYGGLSFDVVGVGDMAFRQCLTLRSADLGTCGYVGERSFSLCSALESVSMPCVESLGYCAFSQCTSLKEIAFGEGLSEVGRSAFYKIVFYGVDGGKLSHTAANLAGKEFVKESGKLREVPSGFALGGLAYRVVSVPTALNVLM